MLRSASGGRTDGTEYLSYQNILRENLDQELFDIRHCAITMAGVAMQHLCAANN
jgi:hypothetical protein